MVSGEKTTNDNKYMRFQRLELLHNFKSLSYRYAFGVMDNKNNFYAIPLCAGNVMKYNIDNGNIAFLPISNTDFAYTGGAFDEKRGCIWGFPRNANTLLKIDTESYKVEEIPLNIKYTSSGINSAHHYSGVLANDCIYCPPRKAGNGILKISLDNFSCESIPITDISDTAISYSGSVLHPNGKIYFLPSIYGKITVFDPESGKMYFIGEKVKHFNFGGVVWRDENIYCVTGDGVIKINVHSDTVETVYKFKIPERFYGTTLHPNGKLYAYGKNNILIEYDPEKNSLAVAARFYDITDENYAANTAGTVMPDGNIYLAPCNGRFFMRCRFVLDNSSPLNTGEDIQKDRGRIEKERIANWLVTGGSSGLGRSLVLKLHSLGYKVAATSRDISKLNDLPSDIVKIQLDVCDIKSCRNAIKTVIDKFGSIDVLVNNAGLSHTSTFEETPYNIGDKIIETNFWGMANMIKSILPFMHQNQNGTVINISSASGFRARNYGSYYVASKFAVESLTKNLKFECHKFMRFMSVELGGLNTGLMQRQTVINTEYDEYKHLPGLYPCKGGYINSIDKSVDAIIATANNYVLPRDLILGWDSYQQFPQVIEEFERETEKYKDISVSTDENKKDSINLQDITLPRNKKIKIQNWLITGASGGFGQILALRLMKLGYTVCVTSRDISRLASFSDDVFKIESLLDTADECQKVVSEAIEKMGSVDVLVNNATSNCWSSFEECPYEIMRDVFYVNYTMPQYMIKSVLPHMRERSNGTIINITSIAAIQPRARVSTYSAAKAALEGLTRVLKSECQRFARFMAVEPVCMQTGIMVHNPVFESKMPDYRELGNYTQEIGNIPNRKDIAAQQIINVVNQTDLPQSLLIGTESYLIAKNEIERSKKDFEEYKDTTLSVCDKLS